MKGAGSLLLIALLLWLPQAAPAASEGPTRKAHVDLSDTRSLQRGARVFVNYCLGCHSAQFVRYSRVMKDLQLPEEVVQKNLLFGTSGKVSDTMKIAMRSTDAAEWFGVPPPDLSVVARSRGPDWLYSYLLDYYADPSRPTGVNNLTFPNTAMPHVLWELQGLQRLVEGEEAEDHGQRLEPGTPGKLNEAEYEKVVADLVNFLVYIGEPAKLVRGKIGFFVLLFLAVFTALAYMLKKEYWKDVH